ncbi:tetratricopeptide repeat protein [Candidatus Albibeggiatoa sp. nov. BB20]|uniref:tetratricopeptide repeat protein n=1 Tax=Candidatus Albibeggiatoa sp. nov. BB20 TaxID=3162723 RepID=UPI0033657C9B
MDSLFEQASQAWDQGNNREAFELFRRAAAKGEQNAFLNLGYCYDEGIGTKQDKEKALFWYKKAAQYGDLSAYMNIAVYYVSVKDFKLAEYWYKEAFDKGEKEAGLELAKLGLNNNISLTNSNILEYLQVVINAKCKIEVCEASQNEAYSLLKKLD